MKKINLLVLLFVTTKLFSQDFELRATPFIESQLIFNDGTTKQGLVKMNSSAFDIRFKTNSEEKAIKIDYEDLNSIVINPGSDNERTFQYRDNFETKFSVFVELVYKDKISIYITTSDRLSLFYSDFDRRTIREQMNAMKFESKTKLKQKVLDTIALPNGKKITLPIRYNYFFEKDFAASASFSMPIDYYLLKEDQDKLMLVSSHKRFLKKYIEHFNDCPLFVEDFKQEKITLDDLPKFIEYYKILCAEIGG